VRNREQRRHQLLASLEAQLVAVIKALKLHAEEDTRCRNQRAEPGAIGEPGGSPERTADVAFKLTSSDFADGGQMPSDLTCDGADRAPRLAWSGAPADTAEFALIMDDPDARGFVHWVVVGIPGSASSLEAKLPAGARAGRTDFGRTGYGGPCPPSGTHRYVTTLYALSEPLGLTGTVSALDVRRATHGETLATAMLTGTYRRQR
jgi:Raf kinase inhibitor-like YbhB/YbcL family protein